MPEVALNDITMHYERRGSGHGVLFLHGLGSSARDWENQVGLADRYELVIPDLRGHGHTSRPPGPYSIEQFAADIAGLLESLSLGPVVVVGISLGGMVAFQLGADRPDLVAGIVAVNALPAFEMKRIGQKVQIAIRKLMTRRLSMRRIGEVLSKRLFPDAGMEAQRATMVERWAENDKAAYQATFNAIVAWHGVAEAMSRFEKPITVISSELDYVAPADKVRYVAAMPSAGMVVIENAHHGVPMELPEQFNEALEQALR